MEQLNFTATTAQKASATGRISIGRTFRALRRTIGESAELQANLRERNPRDPLAIRLAALHVELNRLRMGEPIRVDVLMRSLSGIRNIVPVGEIPEVVA